MYECLLNQTDGITNINKEKPNLVIIESTVYPGVTEEIAVPIIEQNSNLKLNIEIFFHSIFDGNSLFH